MPSITLRFYGFWQFFLAMDCLPLDACSVGEALAQLEEKFGPQIRGRLRAYGIRFDKRVQDYSFILLNGVNIRNLEERKLKDGDVLQIFPAEAGG